MANKFKELIKNKEKDIVSIAKENIEDFDVEPVMEISSDIEKGKNMLKDENKEEEGFSLSSILNLENEKKYSNKTYYLEDKVIEEIKKISKIETKKIKGNVSESKIVNDILKHVLNIK